LRELRRQRRLALGGRRPLPRLATGGSVIFACPPPHLFVLYGESQMEWGVRANDSAARGYLRQLLRAVRLRRHQRLLHRRLTLRGPVRYEGGAVILRCHLPPP
jgi:hypothetical protein